MAHLNSVLRNHPMREPNKQVRRKMLDPVKKEEVEAVTGWSCNFEKGLCDGWSTISEMNFKTVLAIGLTRRPANFYLGEINQFSTSLFTGPLIDHTTLSVYGHALYADSKRARSGKCFENKSKDTVKNCISKTKKEQHTSYKHQLSICLHRTTA